MKIFYSWQSDVPNSACRTFIRECLDAAVDAVAKELSMDEADRPDVDQDTAGVLGAPSIFDTILGKIADADVIVADVTLTGETESSKKQINSNVAIELGYAYGIHGDEPLLLVMNTHYGEPSELPFDLRHRRFPTAYTLSPEASSSEKTKTKSKLVKKLSEILRMYLGAYSPPTESFETTPYTYNRAAYWEMGEKLVEGDSIRGGGVVRLGYAADTPLIYLRIWPKANLEKLSVATLNDFSKATCEPLGGGIGGWSYHRNKYGTITYADDGEEWLGSTTQVMRSGEIRGVNAHLLQNSSDFPPFIPATAFEKGIFASYKNYLSTAQDSLGYPILINVEFGMVNIQGYKITDPTSQYNHFVGPIFGDFHLVVEVDLDSWESVTAALLRFFEETFEAAGVQRPENLHGFPNSPASA